LRKHKVLAETGEAAIGTLLTGPLKSS